MASRIQELLHEIEVAVYGEQVRGAIHDAIEECYTDAPKSFITINNGCRLSAERAFAEC